MGILARPARQARLSEPWETARRRRLKVAELFVSLQGEGSRAGQLTVFLRLTGCALRCRWCDTAWAFTEGRWRDLEGLEADILGAGVGRVCITGGEPLLQPAIAPLARRLGDDHGLDVVVETGGDQNIDVLPASVVRILDIKLPGSGMADRMDRENWRRLTPRDEVKMVVAGRADYEFTREIVRGALAGFSGEILLSPVHGEQDPAELAGWVLADRLPVRVQLQLHKVLWPGRDRGV